MKKTKIIATIGPASEKKEVLRELILNGMNMVRINMAHASQQFLMDIVKKIDALNKELHRSVAVMVDIQGPEVSLGKLINGKATLNTGDKIRIYTNNKIIGDHTKFSVSYSKLVDEVKTNTILKTSDGLVELKVLDKGKDYLLCEVITGGTIYENRTVNVIGTKLNIPFLSEKDQSDIELASKLHVDYLALSFVQTSEDVLKVNDMLINLQDSHISLIAKVESKEAIEDLDEIIKVSDGIMVARGDLGVELPFERIPGIQKMVINKCHHMSKISIVATEMMSSMEHNERPTRAEVSDVATAVSEAVDAVMLSGETTIGKYPIETLSMMSKIVETAEEDTNYYHLLDNAMRTEKQDTTGSIAYSVVDCSNRLRCSAIVTPTMSGYTAKKISRFRPKYPIIALTPNKEVASSLEIYYGIYPVTINALKTFDDMMEKAREVSKDLFDLDSGDKIIVTGGYPFKEIKHTNFMKVEEI